MTLLLLHGSVNSSTLLGILFHMVNRNSVHYSKQQELKDPLSPACIMNLPSFTPQDWVFIILGYELRGTSYPRTSCDSSEVVDLLR